ncbi:hypothetical protein ACH5RR_007202 [Cinchona calisaya]|uniref:Uncharacterized protein n=1 Tax=Cinchona calisaya TaxID=153742 RepID=A0ABD3AR92_9GENT
MTKGIGAAKLGKNCPNIDLKKRENPKKLPSLDKHYFADGLTPTTPTTKYEIRDQHQSRGNEGDWIYKKSALARSFWRPFHGVQSPPWKSAPNKQVHQSLPFLYIQTF